jgi:hypothetical protein
VPVAQVVDEGRLARVDERALVDLVKQLGELRLRSLRGVSLADAARHLERHPLLLSPTVIRSYLWLGVRLETEKSIFNGCESFSVRMTVAGVEVEDRIEAVESSTLRGVGRRLFLGVYP